MNVNSTREALGVARPVWPLTTLSEELGRQFDVAEMTDAVVAAFAGVRLRKLRCPPACLEPPLATVCRHCPPSSSPAAASHLSRASTNRSHFF